MKRPLVTQRVIVSQRVAYLGVAAGGAAYQRAVHVATMVAVAGQGATCGPGPVAATVIGCRAGGSRDGLLLRSAHGLGSDQCWQGIQQGGKPWHSGIHGLGCHNHLASARHTWYKPWSLTATGAVGTARHNATAVMARAPVNHGRC